jgi:hypothetical protein
VHGDTPPLPLDGALLNIDEAVPKHVCDVTLPTHDGQKARCEQGQANKARAAQELTRRPQRLWLETDRRVRKEWCEQGQANKARAAQEPTRRLQRPRLETDGTVEGVM